MCRSRSTFRPAFPIAPANCGGSRSRRRSRGTAASRWSWMARTAATTATRTEAKYELYEHIYWWLRSLESEDDLRGAVRDLARALRRRQRGLLQRAVHDLGRDRRDRRRSACDHRSAHGQPCDAQEGERCGGAQRNAGERRDHRGRARQAARAFQLSGRRPHLGGAARIPYRRGGWVQDRRDDAARACCFPSTPRT